MTNEMVMMNLVNGYNEVAFTHEYIYGFTDRKNVYVAFANADLMPYILKLDKASRGAGYSLRFKPNKQQKEILKMQSRTFVLCSEEFFESEVKTSKYNRGEIFEKMITEYFGQEWKKDHVPFTEDGDITIEGIAYQIKYQKSTFCNESSLASLKK